MTILPLLLASLAAAPSPAGAETISYASRDSGTCSLRAYTSLFPKRVAAQKVSLSAICRYSKADGSWKKVSFPVTAAKVVRPVGNLPAARSHATDTELYDLTALSGLGTEPGLLAVEWSEDGLRQSALLACGGILCNDLSLGPVPYGQRPACLPARKSAEALLVPDPELECYAKFDSEDKPRTHKAADAKTAWRLLVDALEKGDLLAIQELTTRKGFYSLKQGAGHPDVSPEIWRTWGRNWKRSEQRWTSDSEMNFGPEMKAAGVSFLKDAQGWRLQEWRGGE